MASTSQTVCSSPPSSDLCWKYDVFLSFRGVDTRKGITVDIHDRLNRRGIKTFMDDRDLEVGDAISPALLAAIKESRFAIVVLSQNYASSTWCLEELREICQSMEDNRILPLFYHVDPTDVRYQKRSFEEAFFKHESSRRHESEKVRQWKAALNKVANISGWNTNDHKTDNELVDVIVGFLRTKVLPDAIESTGDFQAFKATTQAMDEVMKALKDDQVTAVGVYGMGGVGKTTIVKQIAAQAQKNEIFHHVIMAVISQSPDVVKIQATLAELLGEELREVTEIGRATRLRKEIMRRKKILIILDDIWEGIDLSTIGIPSYDELQKGNSKVLLTTRIKNVCHTMKCQEKITLSVLSEDDSWSLFVRYSRRSFESIKFEEVARRVAGECCGLPIALITIARALGDKELAEWRNAAERLGNSQTANPDDHQEASKCIRLSYDHLKDEDYKSYFLLCCLYPEDYDIPIQDLFRYAIGKGLFPDADTLKEARGRADSVVTHLIHSCLLLKGNDFRTVRMHDVVRDTAINIAKSEEGGFLVKAGCGLKVWPHQLHEHYSAVSLMENHIHKLPEKLVCPRLQVLLLNHIGFITKIPETLFQSPNDLKVLNLSYTHISFLPQSFSLLTDLRALHLDSCENLLDISMLRNFKKLEILSMRDSRFQNFSRAIRGLKNLRMLDMTGASIDSFPSWFRKIKLHNLEELCMYGLKTLQGEGKFFNVSFRVVTSLANLRVLEVCISDAKHIPAYAKSNPNLVEFDIYIGTKRMEKVDTISRKSISLKLDTLRDLPRWFLNSLMNIAERLHWVEGQELRDIFEEYERGGLHALKCLVISSLRNKSKAVRGVTGKPVFENLEELHLYAVDCQGLFAGGLPQGSFVNLKLLKVQFCYNWGNVLLPSTLLLPNLEVVNCSSMEVEYLFGCEASLESPRPKLRKIVLSKLHSLRSIVEASDKKIIFPNLKELSLYELPEFRCESADIECPSLEYLFVRHCPKFSGSLSDFHSRKKIQLRDLLKKNLKLTARRMRRSRRRLNFWRL